MKKLFSSFAVAILLLTVAIPSFADTIHLKDGSVIRGQVIGFKDQQFTVLIGGGAKGRRGTTTVYVEDVESIEFDATSGDAVAVGGNTVPVSQPVRNNAPDEVASKPNIQPAGNGSPAFFTIKVAVRADIANNGWTNSGLVVRKGQRLRINGSGRISLGKRGFSTPAGVPNLPDSDKLLRNEPTGGLIAVIGDDNDDFIFLGPRRDFVAQRDGVLFLGVNEGELTDNTGTYDIVIEAEAGGGATR